MKAKNRPRSTSAIVLSIVVGVLLAVGVKAAQFSFSRNGSLGWKGRMNSTATTTSTHQKDEVTGVSKQSDRRIVSDQDETILPSKMESSTDRSNSNVVAIDNSNDTPAQRSNPDKDVGKVGSKSATTSELSKAEWTIIFRSDDPRVWNTDSATDPKRFAIPVSELKDDIKYVRIARPDRLYVILSISKEQLVQRSEVGQYGWIGTAERRILNAKDSNALQLGVFNLEWRFMGSDQPKKKGAGMGDSKLSRVFIDAPGNKTGHRGWGFGVKVPKRDEQGFSWNGERIEPTVFEIGVKSSELTSDERQHLLN